MNPNNDVIYIINTRIPSVCVSVCVSVCLSVCLCVTYLLRDRLTDLVHIWSKDESQTRDLPRLYFMTLG